MSISGRKQNMSTGSKKRRTANLRRKRGMTIRKTGSLSKEFKTNDRSVYAPVQLIPKRENQKDTAKKTKNANQRKTNNLQKTVPLGSGAFSLVGRRSSKTVSGVTTRYVYDGVQVIAEYD